MVPLFEFGLVLALRFLTELSGNDDDERGAEGGDKDEHQGEQWQDVDHDRT